MTDITDPTDVKKVEKTIEEMVGIYIKMRTRIEEAEERHKSELESLRKSTTSLASTCWASVTNRT